MHFLNKRSLLFGTQLHERLTRHLNLHWIHSQQVLSRHWYQCTTTTTRVHIFCVSVRCILLCSFKQCSLLKNRCVEVFFLLNGFLEGSTCFLSDSVQSPHWFRDSPCPPVFHQHRTPFPPATHLVFLSQILSTRWPWIVLCPNIDPLKHSKLLPETQTTSALRHLERPLQSMPLGEAGEAQNAVFSVGWTWTEKYVPRRLVCLCWVPVCSVNSNAHNWEAAEYQLEGETSG